MFAKDRLVCSWSRLLLVVALFGLFLTACGADMEQTVTFYQDEEWEAEMVIIFPAETIAALGGLADLESQLEQAVDEMEVMGVEVSVDSGRDNENNATYTLHTKGQGLDTLEDVAFGGDAFTVETVGGERRVTVDYYTGDFSDSNNFTLTLIGGKVLSSNGEELGGGRVRWVNPSRIEAVLTERSRFQIGWVLVPAGITLLVVVGVVALSRNRGPRCTNCGNPLSPQAMFCNNCGFPRQIN